MFVLFAPSCVDYMCILSVVKCLLEVNRCGEEWLWLCSDNFGNVCTEGCKREWNGCKGIPQDQFGWIPKLTAWTG